MSEKVNLLEFASTESKDQVLKIIKIDANEKAFLLFTDQSEKITLHYCHEPEVAGYVSCSGTGCVLCRIGREQMQKFLLPVYQLTESYIGILSMSWSLKPSSLLPQILDILKAGKPKIVFAHLIDYKYFVSTGDLRDDMDDGALIIKKFVDDYKAGLHNLTSVYKKIDNDQLLKIESIARMLKLKGLA
jgi:hypothetical protein